VSRMPTKLQRLRLRAFRVACPDQPAGPDVRGAIAVAAVAPDPARLPAVPPRIRRGRSQPCRWDSLDVASIPL